MTTHTPEPASPFEAEGIPDTGEATDAQRATGDAASAYGEEPPHDVPLAVDDYGTTAAEEHAGEPLDLRVSHEEPDVLAAVDQAADESETADGSVGAGAGQGVGRLVEPDEGGRGDTESDLVARDEGTDLGGYSAEESAMHLDNG